MRLWVFAGLVLLITPGALGALTSILQDDAGSGGDASDDAYQPTPLSMTGPAEGTYSGTMVLLDDPADWYNFTLPEGGDIELHVSMDGFPCPVDGPQLVTATFRVQIRDALDHVLDSRATTACSATDLPLTVGPNLPPGNYRIGFTYALTNVPLPDVTLGTHSAGTRSVGTHIVATAADVTAPTADAVVNYVFSLGCHPYC